MRYEKIRSIRPLTQLMLDILQDCHEREIQNGQPADFYDPAVVEGLVKRGLIAYNQRGTKDGKTCKVTALGKEYIKHYFGK